MPGAQSRPRKDGDGGHARWATGICITAGEIQSQQEAPAMEGQDVAMIYVSGYWISFGPAGRKRGTRRIQCRAVGREPWRIGGGDHAQGTKLTRGCNSNSFRNGERAKDAWMYPASLRHHAPAATVIMYKVRKTVRDIMDQCLTENDGCLVEGEGCPGSARGPIETCSL